MGIGMASEKSLRELTKKLDSFERKFGEFERFEEKIDRVIEAKVFEIRLIAYLTLILVAVLFAISLGTILKALGI
jgi:hypothetical protein